MKRYLLIGACFAALAASPAKAVVVTVEDIGSILNESLPLPAEQTPGLGAAFAQYFEFNIPVAETVTLSMSDSATGNRQVTAGFLSLNDWTSTGSTPPFIPAGALIESSPIVNVVGGQESTVLPRGVAAGDYFAEISGLSGASPIHIAIDGTATATVPEASTWAMLTLGFGLFGFAGLWRGRMRRLAI
jgi:hypothetical protein